MLIKYEESVNSDPLLSPVKPRKPIESEKKEALKQDNMRRIKERNRGKDQQPSQRFARQTIEQGKKGTEPYVTVDKAQLLGKQPPETPAQPNLDVLSPNNSPAANRTESRDTPPPVDLSRDLATMEAFGSLGRASRRQRGSVSYAEPNLRVKMRRPTKELVDAVAANEQIREQKTQNGKTDTSDADSIITGTANSEMRTVTVKKESNVENGVPWKRLPLTNISSDKERIRSEAASPLGDRSSIAKGNLPDSVVTERRRRTSMSERSKELETEQYGSGAGSAISALMTENPKSKARKAVVAKHQLREDVKPTEKFDIFELNESSVHSPEHAVKDSEIIQASPKEAKASRRHSSVPGDRIKDAMARRTERRRDETSSTEAREKRTEKEGKAAGVPDLKQARSSAALSGPSGDALPGRAASRRRSMML